MQIISLNSITLSLLLFSSRHAVLATGVRGFGLFSTDDTGGSGGITTGGGTGSLSIGGFGSATTGSGGGSIATTDLSGSGSLFDLGIFGGGGPPPAPETTAPAPDTTAPAPETSAPAPETTAPGPAPSPGGGGGTVFKFINGQSVYTRRFFATGEISGGCVNIDEFCNEIEDGDPSAFVSCYAARKAASKIKGGYSFEGSLRVSGGSGGDISNINLRTDATTAVLALSFSNSESSVGTATSVDVGALSSSGSELSQAAALARGNSTSKSVSVAYASSLGETGSSSFSGTQMIVRADDVSLFEGFATTAATAFALSDVESETLSATAAASYAEAVTAAKTAAANQKVAFAAEAYSNAEAKAGAFGEAVASSVVSVGISFTFATKIVRGGQAGVDIEFGRGISAKLAC